MCLGAFGVDGMDVHKEVGGKNIKDRARSNGGNVKVDGGNGSAKGNLLEEGLGIAGGKGGKGGGGCRQVTAEGNILERG